MEGKTRNRAVENEEMEIDLLQLWQAVRRRLWLVVLCGALVAAITYAVTKYFIKPMYASSSTMLVVTKETTLSSLADLQLGTQLTNDYEIMITSRPVLQKTIEAVGLDMDYKRLRKSLEIAKPNDSRMLIITAMMPDPRLAKKVTDTLAQISSGYIADKMEVTAPKIIEEGEVPEAQASPNVMRNTMVGGLLGVLAVVFLICAATILNDSVQTEDDIERYLELPVLAVVPDRAYTGARRKSRQARQERPGMRYDENPKKRPARRKAR